jgi:hypothetical protein
MTLTAPAICGHCENRDSPVTAENGVTRSRKAAGSHRKDGRHGIIEIGTHAR